MSQNESNGPPPPPNYDEDPGPEEEAQAAVGASASPTTAGASPAAAASVHESPRAVGEDLVAGGVLPAYQVHLFSGASGAGKTTLAAQLLEKLSRGGTFFGLQTRRPAFLGFLAADRTWEDHAQWIRAVGLDPQEVPHYALVDSQEITGKAIRIRTHGDRFELFKNLIGKLLRSQQLDSLPPDSFLIVDPLSLFIGGDLSRYDQVYTHMLDLSQWAMEKRCTLLGLVHTAKQRNDQKSQYARPQDRIFGSMAQTACAGTVLHIAPPSETFEEWSELLLVPHHAPPILLKLDRPAGDGLFLETLHSTPTRKERKVVLQAYKLLEAFPAAPEPIAWKLLLAHAVLQMGLSRATAHRSLLQLASEGLIEKAGRALWRRKPQAPPA